jgi:hypothetical protein
MKFKNWRNSDVEFAKKAAKLALIMFVAQHFTDDVHKFIDIEGFIDKRVKFALSGAHGGTRAHHNNWDRSESRI